MKKIIASLVLLTPSLAFAQTEVITDVNTLSQKIVGIFNLAIYLLIALAVLFIIWNIVMYLIKGGSDEGGRAKAGASILWGIVGLVIILSIWGIVNIFTNTFRTTGNIQTQPIPQVSNNVPIVR